MSEYEKAIRMMVGDVKKGKPIASCVKTTYEDIDRVMTLFQMKRATRMVPDGEKPAAAKALAADKARDGLKKKLAPGPVKKEPAITKDKGRTK